MASMASDGYLSPPFVAMAHRGGALYAPNLSIENTLEAFRNAWDLGFSYLETDVHATSDGHVVAFHDVDLERMTGVTGSIPEHTLEQLRELTVFGEHPIPTLDELFEELPEARFNIDIKEPGAIEPLARTISAHQAQDRVCVGSFSLSRLQRFRKLMPDVVTAVSNVGVSALLFGFGRLPGARGQVFQVPIHHRVAGVNVRIVCPRTIQAAHRFGRKVHVWTIDDADVMHDLIDWGVDGIITDRPDVLKNVLSTRGMWSTR